MNITIVGAASGIGRGMAIWFARNNCNVTAVDKRTDLLDTLTQENSNISAITLDLYEIDEIPNLFNKLQDLDIIIISAGISYIDDDLNFESEHNTIKINVEAWTSLVDHAFIYFKKKGGGHIVAITAMAALVRNKAAGYSASKAYQINYLECLEYRARKESPGLIVTELRPGWVRTAMLKGSKIFWITEVDKAVQMACQAIVKRKRLQYISARWLLLGATFRLLYLLK